MANTAGLSANFLLDLFSGIHDFATDTFKAALYKKTASVGPLTSYYTSSGEVSGLNYVAGGVVVSSLVAPKKTGLVVYWTPSSPISYPSITIATPFDAVVLYNHSKSKRILGVWRFSDATVSNDTFQLKMPPNTPTEALIRAKQVA